MAGTRLLTHMTFLIGAIIIITIASYDIISLGGRPSLPLSEIDELTTEQFLSNFQIPESIKFFKDGECICHTSHGTKDIELLFNNVNLKVNIDTNLYENMKPPTLENLEEMDDYLSGHDLISSGGSTGFIIFTQEMSHLYHKVIIGKGNYWWTYQPYSSCNEENPDWYQNIITKYLDLRASVISPEKLKTENEFLFTLINEDPASIHCKWNFEELFHLYIDKIFGLLNAFTRIKFKSETLNYFALKEYVKKNNDVEESFVLQKSKIPKVIEHSYFPVPLSFSKYVTNKFMLICPAIDHHPLYFVDDSKKLGNDTIKYKNAFLPGQGGVTIVDYSKLLGITKLEQLIENSSFENNSPRVNINPHAAQLIFSSFVEQIRLAIGISTYAIENENVLHIYNSTMGFSSWELEVIKEKVIYYRLIKSIELLTLLSSKVKNTPNIQYNENVVNNIKIALESIKSIENNVNDWNASQRNDHYLDAAVESAFIAFEAAENGYYDLSVQPPEFFPFGHYLAILSPVIAPLIAPLVFGIKSEVTRYKELKAKKVK